MIVLMFFKPFLDNKMSIFEECGAFNVFCPSTLKFNNNRLFYVTDKIHNGVKDFKLTNNKILAKALSS